MRQRVVRKPSSSSQAVAAATAAAAEFSSADSPAPASANPGAEPSVLNRLAELRMRVLASKASPAAAPVASTTAPAVSLPVPVPVSVPAVVAPSEPAMPVQQSSTESVGSSSSDHAVSASSPGTFTDNDSVRDQILSAHHSSSPALAHQQSIGAEPRALDLTQPQSEESESQPDPLVQTPVKSTQRRQSTDESAEPGTPMPMPAFHESDSAAKPGDDEDQAISASIAAEAAAATAAAEAMNQSFLSAPAYASAFVSSYAPPPSKSVLATAPTTISASSSSSGSFFAKRLAAAAAAAPVVKSPMYANAMLPSVALTTPSVPTATTSAASAPSVPPTSISTSSQSALPLQATEPVHTASPPLTSAKPDIQMIRALSKSLFLQGMPDLSQSSSSMRVSTSSQPAPVPHEMSNAVPTPAPAFSTVEHPSPVTVSTVSTASTAASVTPAQDTDSADDEMEAMARALQQMVPPQVQPEATVQISTLSASDFVTPSAAFPVKSADFVEPNVQSVSETTSSHETTESNQTSTSSKSASFVVPSLLAASGVPKPSALAIADAELVSPVPSLLSPASKASFEASQFIATEVEVVDDDEFDWDAVQTRDYNKAGVGSKSSPLSMQMEPTPQAAAASLVSEEEIAKRDALLHEQAMRYEEARRFRRRQRRRSKPRNLFLSSDTNAKSDSDEGSSTDSYDDGDDHRVRRRPLRAPAPIVVQPVQTAKSSLRKQSKYPSVDHLPPLPTHYGTLRHVPAAALNAQANDGDVVVDEDRPRKLGFGRVFDAVTLEQMDWADEAKERARQRELERQQQIAVGMARVRQRAADRRRRAKEKVRPAESSTSDSEERERQQRQPRVHSKKRVSSDSDSNVSGDDSADSDDTFCRKRRFRRRAARRAGRVKVNDQSGDNVQSESNEKAASADASSDVVPSVAAESDQSSTANQVPLVAELTAAQLATIDAGCVVECAMQRVDPQTHLVLSKDWKARTLKIRNGMIVIEGGGGMFSSAADYTFTMHCATIEKHKVESVKMNSHVFDIEAIDHAARLRQVLKRVVQAGGIAIGGSKLKRQRGTMGESDSEDSDDHGEFSIGVDGNPIVKAQPSKPAPPPMEALISAAVGKLMGGKSLEPPRPYAIRVCVPDIDQARTLLSIVELQSRFAETLLRQAVEGSLSFPE